MRDKPLTKRVLNLIAQGKRTRQEAAQALDCSPRQVNRLMAAAGVTRPVPEYLKRRERAEQKWKRRTRAAEDAIGDRISVEAAAKRAGISVRQMYRWIRRRKKDV